MTTEYTTLVYKDAEEVEYPFGHISFLEQDIGAGKVPQMMDRNNTIEGMQKMFPNTDFSNVELIRVVTIFDTKKDSEES